MTFLENLKEQLKDEPAFRYKQAIKAVFVDFVEDWNDVSVFSKNLREKLNKKVPFDLKVVNKELNASTVKVALDFEGDIVESVLMKNRSRNTVCVSTQVGCALKCDFCATGKMGLKRNLNFFEIISQVLYFSRVLKKTDEKVTNVVFMGMGEPFLNYDEVIKAVKVLNDKDYFNIGARKISISTVGIIPGIKKLSKEKIQINLAVSLHAANNKLRNEIMPINKQYPLKDLLIAIRKYILQTKRKVLIEYLLLFDVNDKESDAKELANLLKEYLHSTYSINLIAYNETGKFKPSTYARIKKFKNILERQGIEVMERYKFGRDIKAACGQLATHITHYNS